MAGPFGVLIDPDADPGSKLDPRVVEEITFVAPSSVTNGSITAAKLAPDSVTSEKIAPGAVGQTDIATGGVGPDNLAAEAVTSPKIDDNAVLPIHCGPGVVAAVDATDSPVETTIKYVTSEQWGALTPDPNVEYHVYG